MSTTTYRSISITVFLGLLGRFGYIHLFENNDFSLDAVRILENFKLLESFIFSTIWAQPNDIAKAEALAQSYMKSFGRNISSNSINDNNSTMRNACRVYFAPSTIPGAGMGVFAGKAFDANDEIMAPDGTVPLIDIKWNNDGIQYESLWGEYVWTGRTFPGMNEPEFKVQGASFGVGALPNCMFPLLNTEDGTTIRDHSGIDAGSDPGTGAFTEFHGRSGIATRSIRAGEELFVDYGYSYFDDRKDVFGPIPRLKDYTNVDALLRKFRGLQKDIDRKANRSKISIHPSSTSVDLYNLSTSVAGLWSDRVGVAFPKTLDDVDRVLDVVGTTKLLDYDKIVKDDQWLENSGACMDHLVVQNSRIPHAGRGAFANKLLPEGTIVAPVPLIHYPNRTILNMYNGYLNDNGVYKRNSSELIHQQLLLNYCFGHRDSSLLLCPYGIVSSFVNHGSVKKHQANTKIVWSSKVMSQPGWLDLPVKDWAFQFKAGLAFDYVAIRDIQEGEEVLIDYGDEWEEAWEAHVKSWTPKKRMSQQLNEADPPMVIPTADKWPWPDVHLWCHDIYREYNGLEEIDDKSTARPCRIIASVESTQTGEILYIAEVLDRHHDLPEEYIEHKDGDEFCVDHFREILFNLPRDALTFAGPLDWNDDARFYRETWTFRHDLRIPDDLMPEKWKNNIVNIDD